VHSTRPRAAWPPRQRVLHEGSRSASAAKPPRGRISAPAGGLVKWPAPGSTNVSAQRSGPTEPKPATTTGVNAWPCCRRPPEEPGRCSPSTRPRRCAAARSCESRLPRASRTTASVHPLTGAGAVRSTRPLRSSTQVAEPLVVTTWMASVMPGTGVGAAQNASKTPRSASLGDAS
jgi:hypothetical protein